MVRHQASGAVTALPDAPGPGLPRAGSRGVRRFQVRDLRASPVWLSGAALVTATAVGLVGVVTGHHDRRDGWPALQAAIGVSYLPVGVFMTSRNPRSRIARVILAAGAVAVASAVASCWTSLDGVAWAEEWVWWPPLILMGIALALFPDDRLPSRRWRPLLISMVGFGGMTTAGFAVAALSNPHGLLRTDDPLPGWASALLTVSLVGVVGYLATLAGTTGLLVVRWRRSPLHVRRQILCLLPSALLLLGGLVVDGLVGRGGAWLPAVLALPVTMMVAIAQFSYLDLDLYLQRSIVWLFLMAVSALTFGLVVSVVGTLSGAADPWPVAVVGGAAVALLLPAERLLQRAVSRMLFGLRDDPFAVLLRAGRDMEAAPDPTEVLPRFVQTLVAALKVPWAAVDLEGHSPVEHGRLSEDAALESFPMVTHLRAIGTLRVATRATGQPFTAAERTLLRGLSAQAAVAADVYRTTLDLHAARRRLVLAREEERRRIRGDLHDGVAGSLVSARILLEHHQTLSSRAAPAAARQAAGRTTTSDPPAGDDGLDLVRAALDTCTDELRDLIDGLRPAALDAGLGPALRRLAAASSTPDLPVVCDLDLPEEGGEGAAADPRRVPAAIEIVIYRVAAEAVTNAVKHATGATRCTITVRFGNGPTLLEITDDGRADPAGPGAPADPRHGVGTQSMRERVAEVGGTLDLIPGPTGFTVRALLPRSAS